MFSARHNRLDKNQPITREMRMISISPSNKKENDPVINFPKDKKWSDPAITHNKNPNEVSK